MDAIWKYGIKTDGQRLYDSQVSFEMPKGAKVICVDEQNDDVCLWTIVDTEAEKVKRIFDVVGTGCQRERLHCGLYRK